MNQITIIGNVGITPEMGATSNGKPRCKFTIASNSKRGGEEETQWFTCHVYGDSAANFVRIVSKGDAVVILGRCFMHTFERDGVSKERVHVNVN